ncbi:MAG: hypothetical protein K5685_01390 [Bacteroidales bacterium]|nr:hypothetical protein [Bacteroidales bacterium]
MAKKLKNPIHNKMIDVFNDWYRANRNPDGFGWPIADVVQIDYIYTYLVSTCTRGGFSTENMYILDLWKHLLESLKTYYRWVFDRATPRLISQQYETIVTAIRTRTPVLTYGQRNSATQEQYTQQKLDLLTDMLQTP